MTAGDACPCGSQLALAACCGPRHDGSRPAETAQALMRSRYSAFVLGRGDYLVATREGPGRPGEAEELGTWGHSVHWLGLTVKDVVAGGPADEAGTVAFEARFLEGPELVSLAERSRFSKADGRWRYLDGQPQVTRSTVKRNDACPCGSGRKFKACHA